MLSEFAGLLITRTDSDMKIGIMQPYFIPYIGYWQLINAVDEFIVYDNIQYSKKGWINRNRILDRDKFELITLPLKKDSDYLDVKDRLLSDTWSKDKVKVLNKLNNAYKKAPFFDDTFLLFENLINHESKNLFNYIFNSINTISKHLDIKTKLIISSTVSINHDLKSAEKVIELCKFEKANTYINPIGGVELYSKDHFLENNIELRFLKSDPISYHQFDNEFVPWLSIIDVMMFNSVEEIKCLLQKYTLV